MAFNINNASNKHKRGKRHGFIQNSLPPEVNVTPFVDILLVLLIVFMAASPALVSGLNINLPKGSQNNDLEVKNINITITIDNTGAIFVNDKVSEYTKLVENLSLLKKDGTETIVFLRGDKELVYDKIMSIINLLAKSDFNNIVLVTEHE